MALLLENKRDESAIRALCDGRGTVDVKRSYRSVDEVIADTVWIDQTDLTSNTATVSAKLADDSLTLVLLEQFLNLFLGRRHDEPPLKIHGYEPFIFYDAKPPVIYPASC